MVVSAPAGWHIVGASQTNSARQSNSALPGSCPQGDCSMREKKRRKTARKRRLQEEAEEASPSRRRASSLGGILGANCASSGTDSWHPAWKLVKSLPMDSPSQG